MEVGLIYARARNGVIGRQGALPWHIPEDLAHFKAMTQGCPVVMGRRTWDSLPPRFRPLPGRRNIVVTRQPDWAAEGAQRAASLAEALELCEGAHRVWVIGGSELFARAITHADRVEVTEIDQDFEGDVFAPTLGAEWRREQGKAIRSEAGPVLRFVTYRRHS